MKLKFTLLGIAAMAAAVVSCNSSGNEFEWAPESPEYLPFLDEGGNCSYIDVKKGNKLFTIKSWARSGYLHDGLALGASDWAGTSLLYFDKEGRPLPGSYADATIFSDGLALVVEPSGPICAIDTDGKVLFENKDIQSAQAYHQGYSVFQNQEGKFGVMDTKGEFVVEPVWTDMFPLVSDNLVAVKDDGLFWGVLDVKKNRLVVKCNYDEIGGDCGLRNFITGLNNGYVPVRKYGMWGVVSTSGKEILDMRYNQIIPDGKNIIVKAGSDYGWYTSKGKVMIPPQFSDVQLFYDSKYTAVKRNRSNSWGIIDRHGDWLVRPRYTHIMPFNSDNLAFARSDRDNAWGVIDHEGEWVVNPRFKDIRYIYSDQRVVCQDRKGNFGLVDYDGEFIVPCRYSEVGYPIYALSHEDIDVRSHFVDVDSYASFLAVRLEALSSMTFAELMQEFSLPQSYFPKNGKTRYAILTAKEGMTVRLYAVTNPWRKYDDGWFGYKYSFAPSTKIMNYQFELDFDQYGKIAQSEDAVIAALQEKYPETDEGGTWMLPGGGRLSIVKKGFKVYLNVAF